MKNSRNNLLPEVIEKLTHALHNMHKVRDFPFGDCLLRKQQIMILFFIYENKGEASVKAISHFLNVTPGAVTQFVDALVEKKIVKREESSIDGRSINIKLSSGAVKKFDSFRKKYIESAKPSFADFSESELKQFIKLLEKIKKV